MDFSSLYARLKTKSTQIILGVVCVLFVLLLNIFDNSKISNVVHHFDGIIYDQMMSLYLRHDVNRVRVAVIDIDDESVQKEGRWPWPRDKFALLLDKLKQYGVVVVALDIVMSEPEINYAAGLKDKLTRLKSEPMDFIKNLSSQLDKITPAVDNDQTFVRALHDNDTVMGFLFHDESDVKKGKLPKPLVDETGKEISAANFNLINFKGYNGTLDIFIDAASGGGFVSNLPDNDGTVRRSLLVAGFDNKVYPSLALSAAMRYLLVDKVKLLSREHFGRKRLYGIQLDGTFIPTDSHGQMMIPYWGPPGTLDYYSATDVLNGKVGAKDLEGAIVVVGSSMILFADLHESPVAPSFPGVEMVGNIISAIAGQQAATQFHWHETYGRLCLVAIGLLFALIYPFFSTTALLVITFIVFVVIFGGSIILFSYFNLYMPSTVLTLMILLQAMVNYSYEFILAKRQRSKISQLFGQYVPEEYVKELIDSPNNYSMDGETRDMTAFFADIRNFTTLSESLDASGVKRMLNTFFTPITEIIFNQHGTIDKYVGDMVVAFWGAPMLDKEHVFHAITASLLIFKNLPTINEKMVANNLPAVNIGIGLGTGPMNVGDMGSEFRRAYTVLGDTVNLASRLQDLTKFYQVNILVNEACRANQDDFLWQPVDKVAVKGRRASTMIYQPLCLMTEASPEMVAEQKSYAEALVSYYAKDWSTALTRFDELQRLYPKTYLYQMYSVRIYDFQKTPPPTDWDGVYVHLNK